MAWENTSGTMGAGYGANKAEILQLVREGMQVYDSTDTSIGEVAEVRFGAEVDAGATSGSAPATPAREPLTDEETLVGAVRSALGDESDLDQTELGDRLRQSGFFRLGAGIFQGARYVLPEQIDYVDDDGIHLNVQGDRLLKG